MATPSQRRIQALSKHVGSAPASTADSVMQELEQERANASFPTRLLTNLSDGGEEQTQFREMIMRILAETKDLGENPGVHDLTLEQRRELTLQQVRRYHVLFMTHSSSPSQRDIMAELMGVYDLGLWVRNGVHLGLFMNAIMAQGDKEQQDEWLPATMMLQIYGSYAMTELGHGSHTRGLQTTATFDQATDEFVIHTPTDTATKWWIGAAGETATHTVCFAQLMINGRHHGLQGFIVPLRDLNTHEPLPGIRVGDVGPKMGVNGIDNGWIQFNQVRVPRANMLRKYAHVKRDGSFEQTHKASLAYSALILSRGRLVTLGTGILKKALTIAIRYCGIRRQGNQVNSADPHSEAKLLDYQSHQHRLMPLLATAYAYHFQSTYIHAMLDKFEGGGGELSDAFLADLHGTMAGLKAYASWDILAAIEEARQCCGGSGYSSYNGLSSLLADFSVIVTFEGDNTVMALQTASYLMKSVEDVRSGKKLSGSVEYLEKVDDRTQRQWGVKSLEDLSNPTYLIDALEFLAGNFILKVGDQVATYSNKYSNWREAYNQCQVDLLEASRIHVFYNVALRFVEQVQALKNESKYHALVPVLEALSKLYVLQEFERSAAFFLKTKYMTPAQVDWIHQGVLRACSRIRRDAVALVDAFNLSDGILNSPIGKRDGNVYQHVLQVVQGNTTKAPYYDTVIKPMLEGDTPM